MSAKIEFPANINGVTEVGIAANVDEITDPKMFLTIATSRAFDIQEVGLFEEMGVDMEGIGSAAKGVIESADFSDIVGGETMKAQVISELASNLGKKVKNIASFRTPPRAEKMVNIRQEPDLNKTLLVNAPPTNDPVAKTMWNSFIALTVANGWFPKETPYVTVINPAESEQLADARDADEVNSQGFFDMQKSASLIASTKVSWWLTNHHVGQMESKIDSFAGKVYRAFEVGADEIEARKVLWAAGKWNSTIGWMKTFGIPNLKDDCNDYPYKEVNVTGSADVLMRVRSRPAGAAEPATYEAIYDHASRSVFSVLCPPVDDIGGIRNSNVAIKADPARYHMGAFYLTGQPRIVVAAVSDDSKENLSGYIHATAPTGTLAKAKVILPIGEVQGNMVHTTITTVKSQLAIIASDTASLAMVAALRGGGAMTSIATVENKITTAEIEQAIAEAKAKELATTATAGAPPRSSSV